jgi:uncharacterized Zn-binding protein involved in type VI secretion
MTLGRSSSGAIKIKTDGGLRAVGCACCGGGCACSTMSAAVKTAIASATQVTVNGNSVAWNGSTASSGVQPFGTLSWYISYSGGTMCFLGDTGNNTVALLPEPLTPQECAPTPFASTDIITIQGESYRSVNYFGEPLTVTISFS